MTFSLLLNQAATRIEREYELRVESEGGDFFLDTESNDWYHNGKSLTNLNLTDDPHFRTGINLDSSIVHVPTEGMFSISYCLITRGMGF